MQHPANKTPAPTQGKPASDSCSPPSVSSAPASVPPYHGFTFSSSRLLLRSREFNQLPDSDYRFKTCLNPAETTNATDYRRALNNDADNRRRDSGVESTVYTNVTAKYPPPKFTGTKKGSK